MFESLWKKTASVLEQEVPIHSVNKVWITYISKSYNITLSDILSNIRSLRQSIVWKL